MHETVDKCPKCHKPISATQSASITQWMSVCRCSLTDSFAAQSLSIHICRKCSKRVNLGRKGSFSQYIFRHDLCSCSVPEPEKRTIESQVEIQDSAAIVDDVGDECLALSEDEFPVARYAPLREVGRGASGQVYLCRDRLLNKKVAVKVLHCLTADQLVAFQDEARATSKLQHQNIVSILDFGVIESGLPYMVLEYVPGLTLEQYLDEHGPMPFEDAGFVICQICQALSYAHSQGIYHRDLKPSNVLITKQGNFSVRLIDFGVAKVKEKTLTPTVFQGRTLAGTPLYMSPDQVNGHDYDARSEVYSLGCVLFEMLTGRPPFNGETALEVIAMHWRTEAALVSSLIEEPVPGELEEIVATCLAKDRALRYKSVDDLRMALGEAADSAEEEIELPASFKLSPYVVLCLGVLSCLLILYLVSIASVGGGTESTAKIEPSTSQSDLPEIRIVIEPFEAIDYVKPIGKNGTLTDDELKAVAEVLKGKNTFSLDLARTEITGRGFHYLEKLPVHHMLLSQNSIDEKYLPDLSRIRTLKGLRLASTPISDVALGHIAEFERLTDIDLSFCKNITDAGVAVLATKPNLGWINLASTAISDRSLEALAKSKRLQSIQVDGTAITNNGLAALAGMKSLKSLQFSNCKGIDTRGLTIICNTMPWLEKLSAGDTGIGAGGMQPVRQLKKLEILNLYNSPVDGADLEAIGSLPDLQVLYIAHGTFSDISLKYLYGLKNLESIGIWECEQVTGNGLRDLKNHLRPNVSIMTDKLVDGPIDKSLVELYTDR